jgi:hypothetical protein
MSGRLPRTEALVEVLRMIKIPAKPPRTPMIATHKRGAVLERKRTRPTTDPMTKPGLKVFAASGRCGNVIERSTLSERITNGFPCERA